MFQAVTDFAANAAAKQYLDPLARPGALAALASACARVIDGAQPDRQLAAVRDLVTCAGPADVPTRSRWLSGDGLPTGLAVDPELRWQVLHRLVVLGAAGDAEITDEARLERSASGAEHAAHCRAAIPSTEAKARAWHVIVNDDELPVRFLAAAKGFWQAEQRELTAPYVARYFAEMPAMAARRTPHAARKVAA